MAMRMNGNSQYLVQLQPVVGKRGNVLKASQKEIGYTRVTNVAKLLEDNNSLINWRVRVTMLGLVKDRRLIESVRSMAVDPDANREGLDAIAAQAYADADGWAGSDHGTVLHAAIEAILRGEMTVEQLLPELAPDVHAFLKCMHTYGLEHMGTDWLEFMIVHDDIKVAGCSDTLLRSTVDSPMWREGEVRVGDYKTTKEGSIEYAINAYAIQLALYRRGTPYRQHPEFGGERVEWPDNLSLTQGVIIHVPRGAAKCDLYVVDLEAGWEAAQHALFAREWRKRSDLAFRWAPNAELLNPGLHAAVEAAISGSVVTPIAKPIPTLSLVPPSPPVTLLEIAVAEHPSALNDAAAPHLTVVPDVPLHEQPHMAPQQGSAPRRSLSADLAASPITHVGGIPVVLDSNMSEGKAAFVDVSKLKEEARAATFDTGALDALAAAVPTAPISAPAAPTLPQDRPVPLDEALAAATAAQAALGGTVEEYVPPRLKSLGDLSKIRPADLESLLATERRIQKGRLEAILVHGGQGALEWVAAKWPLGVPGFGGTYEHSWVELDAMEDALYFAEGKLGLPWPAYDMEKPGQPTRTAMVLNATATPHVPEPTTPPPTPEVSAPTNYDYEVIKDTDTTVTDPVIAGLHAAIAALPEARQQWVAAVIGACASVGYPIGVSSRSQRRCAIVAAIIDLAAKCTGDVRPGEAVVAALAWCGINVVEDPNDLPFVVGQLQHSHAVSLRNVARRIGDDLWFTRYPNGTVYCEEAPF